MVSRQLRALTRVRVGLVFGPPIIVADGGVILGVSGSTFEFDGFRKHLLGGVGRDIRRHDAHITLLHSRNVATASGDVLVQVRQIPCPLHIVFDEACIIEQDNGGPWRQVEVHPPLGGGG